MRISWFLLASGALSTAAVAAISSPATVVDGDTLILTDVVVRLHGIDAVEAQQTCKRGMETWQCGQEARRALAELVDGKIVECLPHSTDKYERIVATCTVDGRDLAESLMRSGLAVALPNANDTYTDAEARMKSLRFGIWAGDFQLPGDYRAAVRVTEPIPKRVAVRPPSGAASGPSVNAYYRNCAAARAAGAAPLYRGRPGYRPEMDRDGDGVACEPYRGR